jgi:hypothetical protein
MTKHATTWSYIAGEKGRNRVRVFERGAVITVDYRLEDGRRVSQTLGHNDRDRAKQKADALAAKFASAAARPAGVTTLKSLFDMYLKDKTPGKSASAQGHDRRALALFLKAFGSDRRPSTLSVRDWTSFIERRRRGELAHKQWKRKTVRNEIIRQDLKTLLAVLNWAERARDDRGDFLLDKNPLRGLELPIEAEPRRFPRRLSCWCSFCGTAAIAPRQSGSSHGRTSTLRIERFSGVPTRTRSRTDTSTRCTQNS